MNMRRAACLPRFGAEQKRTGMRARSVILGVIATLALVAGFGTAASAQPVMKHRAVSTIVGHVPSSTVTQAISSPVASATAATAQPSTPALTPPTSCDWGPLRGTVTAYYSDNILYQVSMGWSDLISCLGTGSETMSLLRDQADAYRNTVEVKAGTVGTCVYPNTKNKPCRGVHSTGVDTCLGDLNCAGVYQYLAYRTLELPPGYVWVTYPKTCVTAEGSRELFCGGATNTVDVPSIK